MTISADDVRRLLASDEPEAVLVLVEGRTEVITAGLLDSPDYRGALQVATRDEVVDRTGGTQLSDRELAEQADDLDTAVRNMGG